MHKILEKKIGDSMGESEWLQVTQEEITKFGVVTKDVEPLHTDVDWCKKNSPYKVPIAYGFQTISLLTWFMHDASGAMFSGDENSENFPLNYGFNKLRLITPVRVNSFLRAKFTLAHIEEKRPGELLITANVVVEIKGQERPALVGEWLLLWVTGVGTQQVARSLNTKKQ